MTSDGAIEVSFVSYTDKWHNATYPRISPTRKELSTAGKHVVVTGGGTGIGKAIAVAFAEAGAASVSILGRRVSRLQSATEDIRAAGPQAKVLYASADLTDRASVDTAFKSLTEQTGAKIDIFVSNAASMPVTASTNDYPLDELKKSLEDNVVASFNALQAFIPLAAPGAKVFNVSSGMGHMAPFPGGMLAYSVYKAANIKLFEYFAVDNPDLHFVQIQPGVVDTEMNRKNNIKAQDDGRWLQKTCISDF